MQLGTVGLGRCGSVDERGTLQLAAGPSVRIWLGCVDNWRRPEATPAVRGRRLAGAAVAEHLLRVPGGEARWETAAFVPAGAATAAVLQRVLNDSSEPLAVAVVIGPVREAAVIADGVIADGVTLRLPRRARRVLGAADPAALFAELSHEGPDTVDLTGFAGGYVGLVCPVPHTTALTIVTHPGGDPADRFPVPPEVEQLVSGWQRHLRRGAHVSLDDPDWTAAWDQAVLDLALDSDPACVVPSLTQAATRAVLGWNDALGEAADRALLAQDRRGRVDLGEPQFDTAAAITVWSLLAGRSPADEVYESYLVALTGGVNALLSGRRPALSSCEHRALCLAAQAYGARDENAAAAQLRDVLGSSAPPAAASTLGPVVTLLHEVLAPTPDGGAAYLGWHPDRAGRAVEVRGLPTPLGPLGFALRWHGRRPALLWELPAGLTLTAPTLDPSFETTAEAGETLLREPPGLGPDILETSGVVLDPPSGQSNFN